MGEESPSVEIERHGDVTVVGLVGDHDTLNVDETRRQIQDAAASGGGLVVSLQQTTFFDSAVVHVLFQTDAQLRKFDRQLVLHVGTPAIVKRMLEVSGLEVAIPCVSTLEDAVTIARRQRAGATEWRTS